MTETLELQIVPDDIQIPEDSKKSLKEAFSEYFDQAENLQKQTENITDPELARTARLKIRKIRTESDKTRKRLKEDSLRMSRAIDGAHNILLALVSPIEKRMDDIEHEAERRLLAEHELLCSERLDLLSPYLDPDQPKPDVGKLTEVQFDRLLADSKLLHEAKIKEAARIEQERIAKEKAEAEERERIRLENIKLKAEAEKREKELAKQKEKEDKLKAEAKRLQEEIRAKEKAREIAELKAKAQLAVAEAKAKKELKARLEAQPKPKPQTSDKDKIIALADTLDAIEYPEMTTERGKATVNELRDNLASTAVALRESAYNS